jgi:hypothetical protein
MDGIGSYLLNESVNVIDLVQFVPDFIQKPAVPVISVTPVTKYEMVKYEMVLFVF